MRFLNRYSTSLILLLVLLIGLAGCSIFQTLGFVAPDTPTGLAVGNSKADSLDISWNSSTGATSYQVYRSTSSSGPWTALVYNSTATGFTDKTELSTGTTYYYVVDAKNSAGTSPVSAAASGTTSGGSGLAAPTIVAVAGDSQVTVTWGTVTGATSYNLYWAIGTTVTTTSGTKISNATSPQIVTTLTNGTEYAFIVTAVDSTEESAASDVATATPQSATTPPSAPTITGSLSVTAPSVPTGLTANNPTTTTLDVSWTTADVAQATITWTPVSNATSYNLYWALGSTVTTATGTKISNTTSPQAVANLAYGSQYAFIVTAVNGGGESVASNVVTLTPTMSYQVYRDASSTVTTSSPKVYDGSASSVTDGSLAANFYYYYAVKATNSSGTSALTSSVFGLTAALGGTRTTDFERGGVGGSTAIGAGALVAEEVTTIPAGTLKGIGVTSFASGPLVKAALYTNSAGLPGTLLASTTSATMMMYNGSSGTDMDMAVSSNPTLAAGTYWIVVEVDTTTSLAAVEPAQTFYTKTQPFSVSFPDPFGAGSGPSSNTGLAFYILVQ